MRAMGDHNDRCDACRMQTCTCAQQEAQGDLMTGRDIDGEEWQATKDRLRTTIATRMRWTPEALRWARDNDPGLWSELGPQLLEVGYDMARLDAEVADGLE